MRSAKTRALVLVAAIGVAGLLGASFWFVFVPNWRPPLGPGEVYGVDVSHHQGEVDWDAVAADDIEFAYLKATEGATHADRRFEENWRRAGQVGLQRGAYHFFTLCRPGADQADWFLEVAPPEPGALPPAVDLELAGNCANRPAREAVTAEVDVFLEILEEGWGTEAVLYVGDDWESVYPVRERLARPLWLQRFLMKPTENWGIWQLHGFARVDGIDGPADLNVGRLDIVVGTN